MPDLQFRFVVQFGRNYKNLFEDKYNCGIQMKQKCKQSKINITDIGNKKIN